jgi:hypothetical protein
MRGNRQKRIYSPTRQRVHDVTEWLIDSLAMEKGNPFVSPIQKVTYDAWRHQSRSSNRSRFFLGHGSRLLERIAEFMNLYPYLYTSLVFEENLIRYMRYIVIAEYGGVSWDMSADVEMGWRFSMKGDLWMLASFRKVANLGHRTGLIAFGGQNVEISLHRRMRSQSLAKDRIILRKIGTQTDYNTSAPPRIPVRWKVIRGRSGSA